MKNRSWIPAGLAMLIVGGTAFAQSPLLVERYRKHFAQLRQSDRVHLRTVMEQAAMALRVLDEHAITPPEDGKEPATTAPEDETERRALIDQLYTAGVELKAAAASLQRRPLPPDGFWIQYGQRLKISATGIETISLYPGDPRIAHFVAKAKTACYDCHRNYGGPLEDSGLMLSGKKSYDDPQRLPAGWADKIAQVEKE